MRIVGEERILKVSFQGSGWGRSSNSSCVEDSANNWREHCCSCCGGSSCVERANFELNASPALLSLPLISDPSGPFLSSRLGEKLGPAQFASPSSSLDSFATTTPENKRGSQEAGKEKSNSFTFLRRRRRRFGLTRVTTSISLIFRGFPLSCTCPPL